MVMSYTENVKKIVNRAGIGVAVSIPLGALVLGLLSLLFFGLRYRRRRRRTAARESTAHSAPKADDVQPYLQRKAELEDVQPYLQRKAELEDEGSRIHELEALERRSELEGDIGAHKIPAGTRWTCTSPLPLRPELRGEEHAKEMDARTRALSNSSINEPG